jgi:hypothetical protein
MLQEYVIQVVVNMQIGFGVSETCNDRSDGMCSSNDGPIMLERVVHFDSPLFAFW